MLTIKVEASCGEYFKDICKEMHELGNKLNVLVSCKLNDYEWTAFRDGTFIRFSTPVVIYKNWEDVAKDYRSLRDSKPSSVSMTLSGASDVL